MTNAEKINKVQAELKCSASEAKKMVAFLNWQTKWDEVLQIMYAQYQKDTGEKDIPYTGFAQFIYQQDKQLPADFINTISQNN